MSRRPGWILCWALTPTLLLTACTSDHGAGRSRSPSPEASHESTEEQAGKRLTDQAESALDAVTDEGTSIAAGVERVSDGVHTQPGLVEGVLYKLTVVCAGEGTAEIALTPPGAGGKKPVSCDGTVAFERIKPKDPFRLDIAGRPGASGMIAWRINKV